MMRYERWNDKASHNREGNEDYDERNDQRNLINIIKHKITK